MSLGASWEGSGAGQQGGGGEGAPEAEAELDRHEPVAHRHWHFSPRTRPHHLSPRPEGLKRDDPHCLIYLHIISLVGTGNSVPGPAHTT